MQFSLPLDLKEGDRVLWQSPLGSVPGIYRGPTTQVEGFFKLQEVDGENCWAANPWQVVRL